MMLSEKEQQRRLKLHSEGKTDSEIARIIGVNPNTIRAWRIKNELKNPHEEVPMEQALTYEQCIKMERFLSRLVSLNEKYPGKKLHIGIFIKEYREADLIEI